MGGKRTKLTPQVSSHLPSPITPPAHIVPESPNASTPRIVTSTARTSPARKLSPPASLPPPSPVRSPEEIMSRYVAQVLEIVPDVDPDHCVGLVADHQHLNESTVERILHILFEDPDYPRAKRSNYDDNGKRKTDGSNDNRPNKRAKVDRKNNAGNEDDGLWMNMKRPVVGGMDYHSLAIVGHPCTLIDVSHRRQPLGFSTTKLSLHS